MSAWAENGRGEHERALGSLRAIVYPAPAGGWSWSVTAGTYGVSASETGARSLKTPEEAMAAADAFVVAEAERWGEAAVATQEPGAGPPSIADLNWARTIFRMRASFGDIDEIRASRLAGLSAWLSRLIGVKRESSPPSSVVAPPGDDG